MAITYPIYIIGMPGSGKTTISYRLSKRLKVAFIDTDHLIETKEGMTIKDIFQLKGEAYFRTLETHTLKSLEDFKGIVATGGGIILNQSHCDMMNLGQVIYLDVKVEQLKLRLSKGNHRPKTIVHDIDTLFKQRRALYETCAHMTVQNDVSITETLNDILKHLEA